MYVEFHIPEKTLRDALSFYDNNVDAQDPDMDEIVETLRAIHIEHNKQPESSSCVDCGEDGEMTGHQTCQYPGSAG